MRNRRHFNRHFAAPQAKCKFGTVIESHIGGKLCNRDWPYGHFQIFVDGQLLTAINEETLLEFGGGQPYADRQQLLAAVKRVYGVEAEIDASVEAMLRASLLRRATDQENLRRGQAHLRALNAERFAPEGYTQAELDSWR